MAQLKYFIQTSVVALSLFREDIFLQVSQQPTVLRIVNFKTLGEKPRATPMERQGSCIFLLEQDPGGGNTVWVPAAACPQMSPARREGTPREWAASERMILSLRPLLDDEKTHCNRN